MTPPSSSHSHSAAPARRGGAAVPELRRGVRGAGDAVSYCQAPLAMLGCPTCFRRLFAGANYCSHCGTRAAREDDLGEAEDSLCPSCRKPMSPARVGSLSLAECTACSGVWVSARRFERLCADREAQSAVLHGGALRGQTGAEPMADTARALPAVSALPEIDEQGEFRQRRESRARHLPRARHVLRSRRAAPRRDVHPGRRPGTRAGPRTRGAEGRTGPPARAADVRAAGARGWSR